MSANVIRSGQRFDARTRINAAVDTICQRNPLYYNRIIRMGVHENPNCRDIYTDHNTIGINPAWVDTITQDELCGALVRMAIHTMCRHSLRRGNRDPELWQLSCVLAAQEIIDVSGYTVPNGLPKDSQFYGSYAESIYAKLKQQQQAESEQAQQDSQQGDEPDDGDQDDSSGGGHEGSDEDDDGQDDTGEGTGGQPAPDDGDGGEDSDSSHDTPTGDDGHGDETGGTPVSGSDDGAGDSGPPDSGTGGGGEGAGGQDQEDGDADQPDGSDQQRDVNGNVNPGAPQNNPAGWGEVWDAQHDTGSPLNEDEIASLDHKLSMEIIEDAMSEKRWSPSGLGNIFTELDADGASGVQWGTVLKNALQSTIRSSIDWGRRNKRFLDSEFFMPARGTKPSGDLVIVFDTSQSMWQTKAEQEQVGSEINSIVDIIRPSKVWVLYCDTAIRKVDEYERGDIIEVTPVGGGGTRFEPPFKWVEKQDIHPDALIYFTDGCGSVSDEVEPPYPVFWASTQREPRDSGSREPVPWGEVVWVEIDYDTKR